MSKEKGFANRIQDLVQTTGRFWPGKEEAMKKLTKHLVPNLGTLLVLGLFFLAQAVGAIPLGSPQGPSTTMISYQGRLADADGNPLTGDYQMQFALYSVPTGGSACWSETQTVSVSDGLFNVLLGSVNAIDPSCLTGDVYLGIKVGADSEMTPRELLTSVPYAVRTSAVAGDLDMEGNNILNIGHIELGSHIRLKGSHLVSGEGHMVFNKYNESGTAFCFRKVDTKYGGSPYTDLAKIDNDGNVIVNGRNIYLGGTGNGRIALRQDGSRWLYLLPYGGSNYAYDGVCIGCGSDAGLIVRGKVTTKGIEFLDHFHINVPVNKHGGFWDLKNNNYILQVGSDTQQIDALRTLDMNGRSITNCGALVEANLQTPEELAAERLERFERGDVLCWGDGQLEKCSIPNDRLVQAVADENGKPVVIGAEVIKVLGPVQAGDLLVASSVSGYAMVNNDPAPGTVIAKALEDFDGEKGLIKAMIRNF